MLDWKKWKSAEMSLVEFLLLNVVYESAQKQLPFNIAEEVDAKEFDDLAVSGYVRTGFNKVYITTKGIEVFASSNKNFENFFNLFPQKVSNGRGGHRILRAVDIGSRNSAEAYRKWKMATGNITKREEHIIDCLKAELTARGHYGDLQYMTNMISWIHGKKWEMYEHLLKKPEDEKLNSEKSI